MTPRDRVCGHRREDSSLGPGCDAGAPLDPRTRRPPGDNDRWPWCGVCRLSKESKPRPRLCKETRRDSSCCATTKSPIKSSYAAIKATKMKLDSVKINAGERKRDSTMMCDDVLTFPTKLIFGHIIRGPDRKQSSLKQSWSGVGLELL